MNYQIEPLVLTLKLAFVTTLILFVIGIPLAYWLSYSKSKIKPFIEIFINTPMVLPPSVLGFYFLLAFNPEKTLGKFLKTYFNLELVFSFSGLVLGSMIFCLPFMLQSLQTGFKSLPNSLKEASYTLGKSKFETLVRVLLPNMKPALITGGVLTFSHTIGEFGLVLMIGGNIPNKTKLASIVVYEEVEALNYNNANFYSLILLLISLFMLGILYFSTNYKKV